MVQIDVLHSPIWFQPNQQQGELMNQGIKLKMISEICCILVQTAALKIKEKNSVD